MTPAWTPDGALLFSSDREGRGSESTERIPALGELWRLEGTGPDARFPEVSPDRHTLVFVGYTADGYDLFSVPLTSASWSA